MALYYDLPVFKDVYQLILKIFDYTKDFPKSAYEFVSQVEYKIILIDDRLLAALMIENNVGISTFNSYEVKIIDSDYFE
jgi:restriction system protein